MIEQRRIKNLQDQVNKLSSLAGAIPKAVYERRDSKTGLRLIVMGNGSVFYTSYLGNSKPRGIISSFNPVDQTINQKNIVK